MTKGESLQHKLKTLERMIDALLKLRWKANDLATYRHIDESYYLENIAELEVLAEKLVEAEKRYLNLMQHLCALHVKVREQVQRDLRWLNATRLQDKNSSMIRIDFSSTDINNQSDLEGYS